MQGLFQRLPSLNTEQSAATSRTGISKVPSLTSNARAYVFESGKDVHETYGAHRINSNIGNSILSPQSNNKVRKGFYGETYVLDDAGSFDSQSSPSLSPSKWKPLSKPYQHPKHNPSNSFQLDNSPGRNLPPINANNSMLGRSISPGYSPPIFNPNHPLSPVEKLMMKQAKQLEKLSKRLDEAAAETPRERDRKRYQLSPKLSFIPREPKEDSSPIDRALRSKIMSKIMKSPPSIPIKEEMTPTGSFVLDSPVGSLSPKKGLHVTFEPPKKKKSKLKAVLWMMSLPHLINKKASNKVLEKKKKVDVATTKQIQEYKGSMLEFIQKYCLVPLTKLYKEKKCLVLINEEREDLTEISRKDVERRTIIILGRLIEVMNALKDSINEENLPIPIVEFFANILQDNAILPKRFLTDYEASRLEFTYYGTLKNMSALRAKLILGGFMIVKCLIHIFLNQPWVFLTNIKETPFLAKNLRSCSSAMYCVFMDIFKDSLHIVKDNQKFIDPDKKIKTIRYPPAAHNLNPEETTKPTVEELTGEIITGMCSKKNIRDCFIGESDLVKELKGSIEDCLERLYSVIYQVQVKRMKY